MIKLTIQVTKHVKISLSVPVTVVLLLVSLL